MNEDSGGQVAGPHKFLWFTINVDTLSQAQRIALTGAMLMSLYVPIVALVYLAAWTGSTNNLALDLLSMLLLIGALVWLVVVFVFLVKFLIWMAQQLWKEFGWTRKR